MLDDHQGFFDRKTLVLPEVLLPADLSPEQALKPVFDLVWKSAGMERSSYAPAPPTFPGFVRLLRSLWAHWISNSLMRCCIAGAARSKL